MFFQKECRLVCFTGEAFPQQFRLLVAFELLQFIIQPQCPGGGGDLNLKVCGLDNQSAVFGAVPLEVKAVFLNKGGFFGRGMDGISLAAVFQ